MWPTWFLMFLSMLAEAWFVRRDARIQFLKLQIELLCKMLDGNRVILSPQDRERLLASGAAIKHEVVYVLGIVAVKTYRRWLREQDEGRAPGRVGLRRLP